MTSSSAPLRTRLTPRVLLNYPGFERHREISDALGQRVRVYAFEDTDCRAWYRPFADAVVAAADAHRYLPVYRMGDGEFAFILGSPEEFLPLHRLTARQLFRRVRKWARGQWGELHNGSPGYGWEVYSRAERRTMMDRYAQDLAFIARHGYVTAGLDESAHYTAFAPGVVDWFDANGIHLHAGNYQHVYAVYALFHGPDRDRVLRGRHVLVVNHADEARREAVSRALVERGAAGVQWISISRTKSMLERIDPDAVQRPVDLVLVGAGVGASTLLRQLEPLQVPVLDVGFVLDVLENPDLAWNRPFCVPDGEMELQRIRFLRPADLQRVLDAAPAVRG